MIFHYIILSLIILVLLIISLHGFYPGLCMIFHYIILSSIQFSHHACDLVFWFTLLKGSIMEQIITSPGPKKTQAIVEEDSRYLPIQWAQ